MFFNRIKFKHNNQIVSSASSLASASVGVVVVDEVTGTVWEKTTKGAFIKQKADSDTPTGTIITFTVTTAPAGYLKCNGAAISRTTYAKLFAAIGTMYGAGDGATTFNLPDMRDRFAEGAGGTYSVGTYLEAGLPNITGIFTTHNHYPYLTGPFSSAGTNGVGLGYAETSPVLKIKMDASECSAIYGKSNTVQPNSLVFYYMIKY